MFFLSMDPCSDGIAIDLSFKVVMLYQPDQQGLVDWRNPPNYKESCCSQVGCRYYLPDIHVPSINTLILRHPYLSWDPASILWRMASIYMMHIFHTLEVSIYIYISLISINIYIYECLNTHTPRTKEHAYFWQKKVQESANPIVPRLVSPHGNSKDV